MASAEASSPTGKLMREFFVAIGIATALIAGVFFLPSAHQPSPPVELVASRSQTAPIPPQGSQPAITPPAASTTPAAHPSHPAPSALAQAAAAQSTATVAPPSGEAQAGRQVYRKCQACHSLESGKNTVGPSLAGIVGKKAASDPNYNYSPALRSANLTWDAQTLDAYLLDPQKTVPGNKMPFPGLKTENERKTLLAYLAAASNTGATAATQPTAGPPPRETVQQVQQAQQPSPPATSAGSDAYIGETRYTLRSGIAEGRMVYIGVGGAIDGQVNPVLAAVEGQMVQIILLNGEGAEHDIVFPDQDARSQRITGRGASTSMSFRAGRSGDFVYFCDVPGHRLAGMEGKFLVTPLPPAQTMVEANISHEPGDLPPPIGSRAPQTVRVDLL